MRVLHISSEKSWRGGEQQIAYLINESIKNGVECEVVCRSGSSFEGFCIKNNVKYYSYKFSGLALLVTAINIKKIAKAKSFDIIHVHSAKSHLVVFISLLLGLETPVILSRRVDFVPSDSWLTRKRYNHSGIKKIVGVSNAITDIMKSYLDTKRDRCLTIHSGIDVSKFIFDGESLHSRYDLKINKVLIGNTSALADHKDYYTFIDTAELLLKQRKECHFIIFGEGPLEEAIKEYVREKNLQENITFTGFVDNIPELLPQLDVFLITSKTEGLGTSILDAFASKVPVVATAAGGIPEVVINEKTGLLCCVGDEEQLANSVLRILNDRQLKNKLIDNAINFLIEGFTKEVMAKKTIEVYKKVMAD